MPFRMFKVTVKLRSGKSIKVGSRQMLFYNRDGVRDIAIGEFESYSGLQSEGFTVAQVEPEAAAA